ncbi:hypothetical protein BT96DRAFT_756931, partial [Gymnopus androsaceus JB14]
RTRLSIIWSCIAVLISCTWVSIRPNLPASHEPKWGHTLRKGGLMLAMLLAPEVITLWAARQWIAARKLKTSQSIILANNWHLAHGFFATMGGFTLWDKDKNKPICVLRHTQPDSVTQPDPVTSEATFDNHADTIGEIPKQEIEARSSSDGFPKLIAIGQTAWFIVQLVVRRINHLAITQLEILTVAFAVTNCFVYVLWWNKPQGV